MDERNHCWLMLRIQEPKGFQTMIHCETTSKSLGLFWDSVNLAQTLGKVCPSQNGQCTTAMPFKKKKRLVCEFNAYGKVWPGRLWAWNPLISRTVVLAAEQIDSHRLTTTPQPWTEEPCWVVRFCGWFNLFHWTYNHWPITTECSNIFLWFGLWSTEN